MENQLPVFEDAGPTQEQVDAHNQFVEPESEYILGEHGELRRRYAKPTKRVGHQKENPNRKARRHHKAK